MNITDNPHTERLPFCNVVYWNGNSACGKDDQWTRATIEAFGQFPRFETTEKRDIEAITALMREAYKAGRRDKAEQIRSVFHSP